MSGLGLGRDVDGVTYVNLSEYVRWQVSSLLTSNMISYDGDCDAFD
jgi:hypothetical protein